MTNNLPDPQSIDLGEDAPPKIELEDARPPEFSDEALALRFSAKHADDLCYVAAWSRWHRFDGTRWKVDDTLHAFDLARAVCRAASSQAGDKRIRAALASAKTVAAVERLTKADRRHAATVAQWDAGDWLLNTKGSNDDD